jgi:hypothetical protein
LNDFIFSTADRHHFDNPVYSTAFTGSPMASINGPPARSRLSAAHPLPDSLNNSRVVNKLSASSKKNVNSERERLGALTSVSAAASYLDNDEEEQDTVSDRGKMGLPTYKCRAVIGIRVT